MVGRINVPVASRCSPRPRKRAPWWISRGTIGGVNEEFDSKQSSWEGEKLLTLASNLGALAG